MNGLQNKYNVIITGAGVSGCMAAIAAAREGASVLLLEQYGFSGGALTNAGVGPMMTFHARTKQVWRFCTIHSSVLQRPKAENLYL